MNPHLVPPVFDESELPERLRRLLAMEVDRIVTDLEWRKIFLIETWSRHRDRGPFLDTVFSRWRTISMTDLALLDPDAVTACEAFYRELDELRMYFQYTQDMPSTMEDRLDVAIVRVKAYGALAIDLLGGAPERPIVDFAHPPSTPEDHRPRLTDTLTEAGGAEPAAPTDPAP